VARVPKCRGRGSRRLSEAGGAPSPSPRGARAGESLDWKRDGVGGGIPAPLARQRRCSVDAVFGIVSAKRFTHARVGGAVPAKAGLLYSMIGSD
jgi:hypothetical protein